MSRTLYTKCQVGFPACAHVNLLIFEKILTQMRQGSVPAPEIGGVRAVEFERQDCFAVPILRQNGDLLHPQMRLSRRKESLEEQPGAQPGRTDPGHMSGQYTIVHIQRSAEKVDSPFGKAKGFPF